MVSTYLTFNAYSNCIETVFSFAAVFDSAAVLCVLGLFFSSKTSTAKRNEILNTRLIVSNTSKFLGNYFSGYIPKKPTKLREEQLLQSYFLSLETTKSCSELPNKDTEQLFTELT